MILQIQLYGPPGLSTAQAVQRIWTMKAADLFSIPEKCRAMKIIFLIWTRSTQNISNTLIGRSHISMITVSFPLLRFRDGMPLISGINITAGPILTHDLYLSLIHI